MTSPISLLTSLGQSLWYDNIERRLLENGELAAMIARGDIRGVTSNPTIFKNAIGSSRDYDAALTPLAWSGWEAERIFWQLAIEDIRAAADLFLPLYRETDGGDGYVSLEVSPLLANDAQGTLEEALRLWRLVDRPNLMIKIPATRAGLPAIRQAIAAGINVNVTLIFSLDRYAEVMDAYLSGLEDRLAAGQPLDRIASVASFFVSRLDTKLDPLLAQRGRADLAGRAAVASARLAYARFREVFASERFMKLQSCGARLQRPLWASTGTKNPAYFDTLYVDNLIGPDTVNTVPPATLAAFRDHGRAARTIDHGLDEAKRLFAEIETLGISLRQITAELEAEGVRAFADAFSDLLKTIEARRAAAVSRLGPLAASVPGRVSRLEAEGAADRLWDADPSLWTRDPAGAEEVRKRLGWLRAPLESRAALAEIASLVSAARESGVRKVLLLGMGGSSLAAEVLAQVFAPTATAFAILDSTDPAQVAQAARDFPPSESWYLVASKSGGTAEVNAMFDYFWALSGGDGARFVAITDPGTSLEALARERGFRGVLRADPTVGGRYSALTVFGLLPAALMGLDPARLLERGAWMMRQCGPEWPSARNPGLALGAVLGQAALDGRDKLTVLADPPLGAFGAWLEQLVAESSGKQGKGILPVDDEPLASAPEYGHDRLFVYLRRDGRLDELVEALHRAGHPTLVFEIPDGYDLGAEFYRWEIATAIACAILEVNAFDQPDVQDNKDRTRAKLALLRQTGRLEEGAPVWEGEGLRLYGRERLMGDLRGVLVDFLSQAMPGDYVAINAYLPRTDEMRALLNELRARIRALTGCAVTLGFGPRFLHSTGQLHKGGPANGLFLQITAEPSTDVDIPGQGLTFGALLRAQALGDYEALQARGRRVLRLHLPEPGALRNVIARSFNPKG